MVAGALLKNFSKGNEQTDGKDDGKDGEKGKSDDKGTKDGDKAPAASAGDAMKGASGAAGAPAASGEKKKIVGDPVVLKIGRKEFKRSQVLDDMKLLPPHLIKGIDPNKLFDMLRDQKMSAYLMVEQAKSARMDKQKEFIDRLEQMKDELLARMFLMKEIAPKAESDAALRTRHAKYISEFQSMTERHLYHTMANSETDANAILAELAKGKDFSAVAKEKSVAPSKDKGGDEGFIPIQILPSPIKEKLENLKSGEYTKEALKIPANNGETSYHIFKVAESRASTPQKFEDCKDALKQMIVQEEVMKLIERLEKQYKVEKFNEDGTPYNPAGEVAPKPIVPAVIATPPASS